jgi:hypothetical protein
MFHKVVGVLVCMWYPNLCSYYLQNLNFETLFLHRCDQYHHNLALVDQWAFHTCGHLSGFHMRESCYCFVYVSECCIGTSTLYSSISCLVLGRVSVLLSAVVQEAPCKNK